MELSLGRSQRLKGAAGERWLRDQLRLSGFSTAHRGRQYHGGPDSPDVKCKELPYHWEMKWGYKSGLSIRKVLAQADDECRGAPPIGVWKPQHEPAMAFMYLSDFLELLRRAHEPE